MNKRIFYYDQLRAFAIFCIIACHVSADIVVKTEIFGTNLFFYSLILNSLREIGVPLFVMISGALLLNKKENLNIFFKKRLSRVVMPYLFWLIIFYFFLLIMGNYNFIMFNMNPFDYFFAALMGLKGVWHYLWFVPMILIVYAVIFILNKLNEKNDKTLKIALVLSIILIILMDLKFITLSNILVSYMSYSVFAIIGYHLANFDISNNRYLENINLTNNSLCVFSCLLMLVIFIYQLLLDFNLSILNAKFSHVSYFDISNVFLLISIFLFFMFISRSSGKLREIYNFLESSYIGKITLSLSLCSYGIYLCHMMILLSLKFLLDYLKPQMPSIYLTILLFLTILCSWLLILILDKVPYIKYFSGKS